MTATPLAPVPSAPDLASIWAQVHQLESELGVAPSFASLSPDTAALWVAEAHLSYLERLIVARDDAASPDTSELTGCPECVGFGPIGREHHDFILACLDGDVADLWALVQYCDADAAGEVAPDGDWTFPVPYSELPEFVARHNHHAPAASLDFVRFVVEQLARGDRRHGLSVA